MGCTPCESKVCAFFLATRCADDSAQTAGHWPGSTRMIWAIVVNPEQSPPLARLHSTLSSDDQQVNHSRFGRDVLRCVYVNNADSSQETVGMSMCSQR